MERMRRGRAAERRERRESLAEKLAARPGEVNLGGGGRAVCFACLHIFIGNSARTAGPTERESFLRLQFHGLLAI